MYSMYEKDKYVLKYIVINNCNLNLIVKRIVKCTKDIDEYL